jgi:general secretion pathway protein H
MGPGAGLRRRPRAAERGFTLLELLVVLMLLALSASIAAPSIARSIDSIRLRAEVASFAAVLRHAREQAIALRQSHAVVVADGQLRVVADDEVRRTRVLPATWTVETEPPHLRLRFAPQGSSTGGEYRIVAGTIAYRITVDALTGRVRSVRQ